MSSLWSILSVLVLGLTSGVAGETNISAPSSRQCVANPSGSVKLDVDVVGVPGAPGPRGPQGVVGLMGPPCKGPKGSRGAEGVQGPRGERGEEGPIGSPGERGEGGARGPRGLAGERGVQGPKGDPGDTVLSDKEFQSMTAQVITEMKRYSKFMTPTWIYNNANFVNRNAIVSHDAKRLTLKSLQLHGLILTIPLSFDRCSRGEDVFKVTISLQTPSRDSDPYVGIGNAGGTVAAVWILEQRPNAILLQSLVPSSGNVYSPTKAEQSGGSTVPAPFDEESTFIYKPSEDFGAFYSGTAVVTGTFQHRPNMTDDVHLVLIGHNVNEIYKIQYIHVEITSS
uniref:Uncharacterized protein 23 n=1 Tax=Halisarca dujardinii TaxID=2583056 RepID=A0AA96MNV9_HALDU|nr:uncharacterized protein 23 [Halisarca dujardinii]